MSKKPIEPKSANPTDLPFLHPESKKLEILHFKKRIMPDSWFEKITRKGKTLPDYPAILILSDIVFRYMPEKIELKDDFGEIIKKCSKNYFDGTRLERTYGYYEEAEHLSRAQAKRGMDNLVRLGLIKLEIKDKIVRVGKKVKTFRNKLFIEPVSERIAEVTFGADAFKEIINKYQGIASGSSQICQDSTSQICEVYNNYTYKEKTTTNPKDKSQSSLQKSKTKIPQELIDELPEEYRTNRSVLKNLSDALNGVFRYSEKGLQEEGVTEATTSTLLDNIKYTNGYYERGKIHSSYSGHLHKSIDLGLELVKPKTEEKKEERAKYDDWNYLWKEANHE